MPGRAIALLKPTSHFWALRCNYKTTNMSMACHRQRVAWTQMYTTGSALKSPNTLPQIINGLVIFPWSMWNRRSRQRILLLTIASSLTQNTLHWAALGGGRWNSNGNGHTSAQMKHSRLAGRIYLHRLQPSPFGHCSIFLSLQYISQSSLENSLVKFPV